MDPHQEPEQKQPPFDADLQFDFLVLEKELEALRLRRAGVFDEHAQAGAYTGGATTPAPTRPDTGDDTAPDAMIAAGTGVPVSTGTEAASREEWRVNQLGEKFAGAHRLRPFGLAFSGGGIRSATFNLGILQGLSEMQLLKHVDYLSTVSGGGYIGSWFHALVRSRRCAGSVREAERILSSETNPAPGMAYEDAIAFLRKYSNYLAPSPGLFSADTWVIGSIWLRNVVLNQLILIPTFVAVILAMILVGFGYQAAELQAWAQSTAGIVAGLIPLGVGLLVACGNLREVQARTHRRAGDDVTRKPGEKNEEKGSPAPAGTAAPTKLESARSPFTRHFRSVGPLMFLSGLMLSLAHLSYADLLAEFGSPRTLALVAGLFVLFVSLQSFGGFPQCYYRARGITESEVSVAMRVRILVLTLVMSAAATALALALLVGFWSIPFAEDGWGPWVRLTIGPPLASASLITGVVLLIGLMGIDYPDAGREWLARAGAVTSLYCVAWAAVFAVGIMGPFALAKLLTKYFAVGVAALSGWLVTTLAGVLAGQSARTKTGDDAPEQGTGNKALAFVASIAPSLFLLGYVLFVGIGVHVTLARIAGVTETRRYVAEPTQTTYTVEVSGTAQPASAAPVVVPNGRVPAVSSTPGTYTVDVKETPVVGWVATVLTPVATFQSHYFEALDYVPATAHSVLLGLLAMLVVTFIASLRININEFSLHHFYKNRLVRCYLGAAKAERRQASPFTGFDPRDDFPIADLLPRELTDEEKAYRKVYTGPFAIINTALNLNVGSELAKQERKATSFVFTPAYCGFMPAVSRRDKQQKDEQDSDHDPNGFKLRGYTPTAAYSGPGGPRIGTAMAISGAAANPNSGCHTSGPMAFLLTVFDARLGWWLGNPRWPKARTQPGPRFAWYYLFRELLGLTTGRSQFVNLSDGGHFENLGLYELVRRRCRYIIVCDSEEDRRFTFEGLGGAVRKCRADFGVEIEINPEPIRLRAVGGERLSGAHCVVGRITYPEQEQGRQAEFAGHGYPDQARADQLRERSQGRATGWLLYIKSSVTGDEPADILEYRMKFADFPHQTTGDQFFTESQFESYRRLGLHVARHAFEGIDEPRASGDPDVELLEVFQQLAQKWYVPTGVDHLEAAQLTQAYSQLLRTAATSDPLPRLAADVLPRLKAKTGLEPRELVLTLEAIQLMQNVFVAYRLEIPANRNNPRIAGWLAVFQRWAQSPQLYDVWNEVKGDYNPLFQKFMRDLKADSMRLDGRRP